MPAQWHTWMAISHMIEGTGTRDVRENTNTADSMTPQHGFVHYTRWPCKQLNHGLVAGMRKSRKTKETEEFRKCKLSALESELNLLPSDCLRALV